jgi:hypothetical protein
MGQPGGQAAAGRGLSRLSAIAKLADYLVGLVIMTRWKSPRTVAAPNEKAAEATGSADQTLSAWLVVHAYAENVVAQMTGHAGYRR